MQDQDRDEEPALLANEQIVDLFPAFNSQYYYASAFYSIPNFSFTSASTLTSIE